MGSWNDFYILALGEDEVLRACLDGQISDLSRRFLALLASAPKAAPVGLGARIRDWFGGGDSAP